MIVKVKETGKKISVNNSYGTRLIEQGKAAPVRPRKEKTASGAKPVKKKADNGAG